MSQRAARVCRMQGEDAACLRAPGETPAAPRPCAAGEAVAGSLLQLSFSGSVPFSPQASGPDPLRRVIVKVSLHSSVPRAWFFSLWAKPKCLGRAGGGRVIIGEQSEEEPASPAASWGLLHIRVQNRCRRE